MSLQDRLFTAAEAGAISGLNLKAVQNAVDKKIIDPVRVGESALRSSANAKAARHFTRDDLLRLRVWRGVGETLSSERRGNLFAAIQAEPRAKTVKADDLLIVDVGEARRQVDRGLRELEAAEALVVKNPAILGGEPVFRGTRIPVYAIAAMLGDGAARDEILSGYPALTAKMVELSMIWAAAHPRRGRPKSLGDLGVPVKSQKRAPRGNDPLPNWTASPADR